ncbi:MAG: ABC transporter ATP-binding protein [Thaumarchaeota archaeon]|nr:ABC transporter ATP-binding protein [Nitrososphaerota archaeon]
MLTLRDVSSGYDGNEILHSIALEIERPAIYVVLGPNGAGKTTLFRTVAGVLKPTTGGVMLDGNDLYAANELRHEIGYLSHYPALPEEMTVAKALGYYGAIEQGDVQAAIDSLGLRDLAMKKVNDLSQGQKKRASIAKLFLKERKLYLMDEPTSNLDPVVAKEVRDILLKLSKDRFVLYSSHNLYEAQEIGDYIILIKEGRLGFFGTKDELKAGGYRIGLKASASLSGLFPNGKMEKDYFVVPVAGPKDVGEVVRKVVAAGIAVYEAKEMGNPLEDLFTGGAT